MLVKNIMILFARAEFTMYLTHAQHLGTEHVVNIYFMLCNSWHRFSKEKIINNFANFLQLIYYHCLVMLKYPEVKT